VRERRHDTLLEIGEEDFAVHRGVDHERGCTGEVTITIKILSEFLLFSCLAAFVTGIVLVVASLLI
jgi:hypothetical protein